QDHPNLEILVVDDGSTDDSLEIARRYEGQVRVLTQENQGLAMTCNRGVREASGEYFVFLSADDRLEPRYVSELLRAVEYEPEASFAYCSSRLFGAESGIAPSRPFSAFSLVRGRNYINGSALTRRSAYLEAGGYPEDLGEGSFDDWDFWLSMLDHGHRGTYVPEPLLHWRRHEGGSRDPASRGKAEAETARIRCRHLELQRGASGLGGLAAYALDRAVGLADRLIGISRRPRMLSACERASWRRFSARRAA
ncbi:MAG TPA: glycosyltransferase, partial [Gaiellaceae bacterium]|nr:glycosyltransferase [Gaiellaceae bacterium]